MNISRDDATTWAGWFKALGDPTRILILHLLATESRPMNVGEIVDALDVGQSTISHHLQILGETCFVHVERVGNSSWWRINERCLDCFPSAAELIMGRLPLTVPWDDTAVACGPERRADDRERARRRLPTQRGKRRRRWWCSWTIP